MALVDAKDIGSLPEATQYVSLESVTAFVEGGGSVNSANKTGRSLLMIAVDQNRMDVFDYLLSRGVDVDAKTVTGWTAIDLAEGKGRSEMFERLLKVGARRTPGGVIKPPPRLKPS